jgi:SAM-dependent methyltransferase
MSVFKKNYSSIYDTLYKHKNYLKESKFINKLIKKYNNKSKSILELGCGTGSYTKFFLKKFDVTAVDFSSAMLDLAKKKIKSNRVKFIKKNILNYKSPKKKYDVIGSFFDVVSYFENNNKFKNFLRLSNYNLNKNGLIFFDFWNKDGVLNLKPNNRIKYFDVNKFNLIKITEPNWIKKKDEILVKTKIFKIYKNSNKYETTEEVHKMRYYKLNYVINELENHDFKFLGWHELNRKKLNLDKCWSILVVAKKIN